MRFFEGGIFRRDFKERFFTGFLTGFSGPLIAGQFAKFVERVQRLARRKLIGAERL